MDLQKKPTARKRIPLLSCVRLSQNSDLSHLAGTRLQWSTGVGRRDPPWIQCEYIFEDNAKSFLILIFVSEMLTFVKRVVDKSNARGEGLNFSPQYPGVGRREIDHNM